MALRVALDTNRYTDFCRGDAAVRAVIERADRIYMPFITLGELRTGFLAGGRTAANERTLVEFLRSPEVEVLLADEATTHEFARVMSDLRKGGGPLPTNDVWIAALCIQHGAPLYTRDRHFDRIPRLLRV